MVSRFLIKKKMGTLAKKARTNFTIVFADGSTFSNHQGAEKIKITFKNARAERALALLDEVGFARSYFAGDIDIEGYIGELQNITQTGTGDIDEDKNPTRQAIFDFFHELKFSNKNIVQAKDNAKFHYNLGSEDLFFRYLDANSPYNIAPTYTCAYWKEGTRDLNEAQFNKLEHVCRKVRLKPGDKLVDVGSGWGSLLFHAYEHYGISEGVNISPTPDQNRWMREKIALNNLESIIKVREADFREIDGLEGQFDAYISTGVYEHAGVGQLEDWIAAMAKLLKPGGHGVLHFIGLQKKGRTSSFIRDSIFPGGYLPELGETLSLMQKHGLEMLDVENLRRHYYFTLSSWAKNFDENWPLIQGSNPEKFDEKFRRRWHMYLWGCAEGFYRDNVGVGLYQITFGKQATKAYPMSREFLYKDPIVPTPTKLKR